MITSARIENFKGFKDLHIPELARITILGGHNNVGKTAVLEALYLFKNRAEPEMFLRHFAWRGIETFSLEPEVAVAPLFRDYRTDNKIMIALAEDKHEETMEVEFNYSYAQKSIELPLPKYDEQTLQAMSNLKSLPSYSLDITYKSDSKKEQHSQLLVKSDRIDIQVAPRAAKPQPVVFLGERARFDTNEEAVRFGLLDVEGKLDIVVELLQIIEPRLQSLSSIALWQPSLVHGDIGVGRKIPLMYMGQGMDRLLSIILAITTSRNGLILIDDIEEGFHRSAMTKIWEGLSKLVQEYNCQLIVTTHSYECLQAAHEGLAHVGSAEDFRYVRLDRRPDNILAVTYSYEILGAALDSGWEVR